MNGVHRERIVQVAHDHFKSRGYRSVTVSDLSNQLGISKKTVYQYFSGKEEIAAAVIEKTMKRITTTVEHSGIQESDPLKALKQMLERVKDEIIRLGPLFLEDVQKYLPDLWREIEQFRSKNIGFIEDLLEKAKQDGLIKNVDPHLAMLIFLETVQALVKPDAAAQHGYALTDVLDTLINIFCDGLVES